MNNQNLQNLKYIILKYRKIILILSVLLIVPLILLALRGGSTTKPQPIIPNPSPAPSITPYVVQQRFAVIKTDPANGQTGVDAGEIFISFTTNIPITSERGFSMEISPALPLYWKFINEYPTTTITAQVYGGLAVSQQYLVTVKDAAGLTVSSWTFTTTDEIPESSSGYSVDQDKIIIQKYYPLDPYLPYQTKDFTVAYYTTDLTLTVEATNKDLNLVKKEVNAWIRSKGIDPSTHTINYK